MRYLDKVLGFKCARCGKEYDIRSLNYNCVGCGTNLSIVLNYDRIKKNVSKKKFRAKKDLSIWRYFDLLPLKKGVRAPSLQIGWTPLYKFNVFDREIYIKDDSRNPSFSLKDRASAVVICRAGELGVERIVAASTGNAGSSMACLCANSNLPCVILVPENIPKEKLAQLNVYGANVVLVKGNYDQAYALSIEATKKFGWYNRNTGFNPFTREGKKTVAFEICEQMNWSAPDRIFVPVGDGNIISGIWKGLCDLKGVGLIARRPRLVAVQSKNSSAVVRTLNLLKNKKTAIKDIKIYPVKSRTIADSISVDMPRDGKMAVYSVLESRGHGVTVSDAEILKAVKKLANDFGIFAEPAGAAAFAGFCKIQENIPQKEKIVCLVTGSGLKDLRPVLKGINSNLKIKANIGGLEKANSKIVKLL